RSPQTFLLLIDAIRLRKLLNLNDRHQPILNRILDSMRGRTNYWRYIASAALRSGATAGLSSSAFGLGWREHQCFACYWPETGAPPMAEAAFLSDRPPSISPAHLL